MEDDLKSAGSAVDDRDDRRLDVVLMEAGAGTGFLGLVLAFAAGFAVGLGRALRIGGGFANFSSPSEVCLELANFVSPFLDDCPALMLLRFIS